MTGRPEFLRACEAFLGETPDEFKGSDVAQAFATIVTVIASRSGGLPEESVAGIFDTARDAVLMSMAEAERGGETLQ